MEFSGQYLTYEEYRALGGTLDLSSFNLLEFRSRKEIDSRTQGRLKELNEQIQEVKICDYDLINKINTFIKSENRDRSVSSEHTDGYSVTYNDINKEFTNQEKIEIAKTIDTYLDECKLENGTPYLYRG
jgi:hypothetical protein